jgi:hypothetical protein
VGFSLVILQASESILGSGKNPVLQLGLSDGKKGSQNPLSQFDFTIAR